MIPSAMRLSVKRLHANTAAHIVTMSINQSINQSIIGFICQNIE